MRYQMPSLCIISGAANLVHHHDGSKGVANCNDTAQQGSSTAGAYEIDE